MIYLFVNNYPAISETFIEAHIKALDARALQYIVIARNIRGHADPEKYVGLTFPASFLSRLIFVLRNIFRLKLRDLSLMMTRAALYQEILNLELVYVLLFFRRNNIRIKSGIIHAHFGPNGALVENLRFLGLIGKDVKLVTHFHGLDFIQNERNMKRYTFLFRHGDHFICGSDYARRQIAQLGCTIDKISVIPFGVNVRTEAVHRDRPGVPFQILMIGRLVPVKGVGLVVPIAKKLLSMNITDFRITIIGDGIQRGMIQQDISSSGLDPYIQLAGSKKHEEVKQHLQSADVFLYTGITDSQGREESQGIALLEAQLFSLPVICSAVGGAKDMVSDGISGFHVKQKDIDGFVDKIILLRSNHQLWSDMSKQARTWVVHHFDQDVQFGKFFSIYESLTNGSREALAQ